MVVVAVVVVCVSTRRVVGADDDELGLVDTLHPAEFDARLLRHIVQTDVCARAAESLFCDLQNSLVIAPRIGTRFSLDGL